MIRDHRNIREIQNDREEVSASTPEIETASGKLPPNKPMQKVNNEVDPKDADGSARIDHNVTACEIPKPSKKTFATKWRLSILCRGLKVEMKLV